MWLQATYYNLVGKNAAVKSETHDLSSMTIMVKIHS